MEFLRFLENIRLPVLNELMLAITYLGDEIAFLVIALILYWCVDKRHGYYIMAVGFLGTIANQFMKLWFRVPRPWVLDGNFTILEQARAGAGGYSFPSGHTQSAVGTFGGIACITKDKRVRAVAVALAVLVPFSRMYVGVHTPADVAVAALIAVVLIFALRPAVYGKNGKYVPMLLVGLLVASAGYLWFVECYPFPADTDTHNLASGTENAYKLLGALLGLIAAYWADRKWLHFETKAVWWAQILKVVLGIGLVALVKSGTKAPLNLLLGDAAGKAARYFLIVIVAGILWPMTFRFFAKLGTKE